MKQIFLPLLFGCLKTFRTFAPFSLGESRWLSGGVKSFTRFLCTASILCLSVLYVQGQKQNPVIISPPDGDAVTAYFQQFPDNPSGNKIAFTVFHAPDTMEVMVRDLVSGAFTSVAKIKGQGRHVGAHPIWVDDHTLIYSTFIKKGIYRHDLKTGIVEQYEGNDISDYSPANNKLLFISKDQSKGPVGVYVLDFNTKETKCLVSVKDIAPLKSEIGTENPVEYWKLIHPYWSPDGKKINFQITTAKNKSTAKDDYSFYCDENGKNIHFIGRKPIHPQWWDNESIYGHDWQDKKDYHARRYDLKGKVLEELSGPGCHGTVSPDRKWVVTESWYDSDPIEVFLYKKGETRPTGMLFTQPATVNGIKFWETRSHVHPAFSRDGKKVYFNAQGADGKSKVWCYDLADIIK